jgi:hypothetical protein
LFGKLNISERLLVLSIYIVSRVKENKEERGTNTLTILMHQMHISTTHQVSSVMLRSKKMEIQKKNVKSERAVG